MKKEISQNVTISFSQCHHELLSIAFASLIMLYHLMEDDIPTSYSQDTRKRLLCHRLIKFIHDAPELNDPILFYSCYYEGSALKHLITDDRKEALAYAHEETED